MYYARKTTPVMILYMSYNFQNIVLEFQRYQNLLAYEKFFLSLFLFITINRNKVPVANMSGVVHFC